MSLPPAILPALVTLAVIPTTLTAQQQGPPTDSALARPDEPANLSNTRAVIQAMNVLYPDSLEEAGVSGQGRIWVRVSENGKVAEAAIRNSLGHPALDSAALDVAQFMVYEPATKAGKPVASWTSQGIAFRPSDADRLNEIERPLPNPRLRTLGGATVSLHAALGDGPAFVHFVASWCPGCRRELPAIEKIGESAAGEGITFVTIALGSSDIEVIRDWRDSLELDHTVLVGLNQGWLREELGAVGGIPYSVVVDGTTVTGEVIGPVDEATLRAILSEAAPVPR